MRELAQRLGALDQADLSETLKVVTYFDTLLTRGAGVDAFVRGAAVLAGVAAGFVHPLHQISIRIDATGAATQAPLPPNHPEWPLHYLNDGSGAVAWIERPGGPLLLDAMLLERLAVGVRLTLDRISPLGMNDAAAMELLVVESATPDAKRKALRRMHLNEDSAVRIAVTTVEDTISGIERTAAIDTAFGRAQAHIVLDNDALDKTQRVGVGSPVRATDIGLSWEQAIFAWRLTSRLHPLLHWHQVASLAPVVSASDNGVTAADVEAIEHLARDPWVIDTLEALASTDSARQAASLLGLHHSTVQARQAQLEAALGYKASEYLGRTRIMLALAGYRAQHARFTVSAT